MLSGWTIRPAKSEIWRACKPVTFAAIAVVIAACSANKPSPVRNAAPGAAGSEADGALANAEADAVVEAAPVCDASNPFCSKSPVLQTSTSTTLIPMMTDCGSTPIDLKPAGVNIMLAIDGSAAMAKHWDDIGTAIRSLREANPTASFGVHVFWADAIPLESSDQALNNTNNACLEVHNKVLDLGDHTAQQLVDFMGSEPQGGQVIEDVYQVVTLIDPLNTYLTSTTELSDPTRTNYLLVFTNAQENCFGSAFTGAKDKLNAYTKLAIELSKKNIRLVPVGMTEPASQADMMNAFGPGFVGTNIMNLKSDYEVLGTMLEHGGTTLQEVPRIDTPQNLKQLVSVVGAAVNNCRFSLPTSLDQSQSVNAFEVAFSINGKTVPRDRHRDNGWDFVRGSTSEVEFFGQGCQAIQAGNELVAGKSCATDICGKAAVNVSTKPRVVMLLLDSSGSRTECADGSFDCFSLGSDPNHTLSYWEVVQRAVGSVLLAPVNDDVAFGMHFFPSKNAEQFTCDVAPEPEIPPGPGLQIEIMKAMLEKLPLGLSPQVAVMESVAAQPGPLVAPDVVGAVVLLSDGGDNCTGDPQAQIVSRLGDAAKDLFDRGVRSFAIRYGSADGETADAAEQLNAVTINGGTEPANHADGPAYIDAKTPEEFESALTSISDQLATCAFQLGDVGPDVDRDRASLFLDGEQIAFDAMATKQDGWSWADPGQSSIELYGEACSNFKSNRHTSIVVEFGCMPVLVSPD